MLASVIHLALRRAARSAFVPPPPVSFTAIRQAIARAESLVERPPPPPAEPQPGKVLPFRRPASVPPPPQPPPVPAARHLPAPPRPAYRDEGLIIQEINGCKMLLLEIVRRTAFDWVLYRSSRRLVQKVLAEQAYRWLFLENPGTSEWNERCREGKDVTSFVAICLALDLDPDKVRGHIRNLTPKNVTSVGRPAEYRKRDVSSSSNDDVYALEGGLVSYNESAPSDEEPFY
jgi:hypothetical protein